MFASDISGYAAIFCYGVEKGRPVNHLEFYGVENVWCNRTSQKPGARYFCFSDSFFTKSEKSGLLGLIAIREKLKRNVTVAIC